jgi:hypothetical protein
MGEVSSEYFAFPYQLSFQQLLHIHLPSGGGTIGPIVAGELSKLSLTPRNEL